MTEKQKILEAAAKRVERAKNKYEMEKNYYEFVQRAYNEDMTPKEPYNLRVVEGKEVRIGEE